MRMGSVYNGGYRALALFAEVLEELEAPCGILCAGG